MNMTPLTRAKIRAGCYDFHVLWDPKVYQGALCPLCGRPQPAHDRIDTHAVAPDSGSANYSGVHSPPELT